VYAEKPQDGSWTEPVVINPTPAGESITPDIAIDSNNNPHLTWVEYVTTNYSYYVMYSYRNSLGVWSTPESPSGAFLRKTSDTDPRPEIEIDSLDQIHLIWNEHYSPIQYSFRPIDGIWSAKQAIPSSISNSSSHSMVIDSTDTLHIVASQLTSEGTKYFTRSAEGTWSTPVLMNSGGYYYHVRDMAIDPDGHLYLVWQSGSSIHEVYIAEKSPEGAWSAPVLFTTDADLYGKVHISSGPDGKLHVVWRTYPEGYAVYKTRFPDGLWSPEILITQLSDGYDMDIAGGVDGQAHFIQRRTFTPFHYDMLYFLLDQPQVSDSYITQTVTVPEDMNRPTLTFMHKSVHTPDPATFNVLINDELVHTVPPSEPTWNLNWIDLADWSGQTIEIKFQSQSDITTGLSTNYIDDVSIGSYLMPRIDQITPSGITTSWYGQILTVSGDNFIDPVTVMLDGITMTNVTFVDGTTLQIQLPDGLLPGLYDLTIINPLEQEAYLANALWLGQPFYLPLIINTSSD
jgi:hypothetical protein